MLDSSAVPPGYTLLENGNAAAVVRADLAEAFARAQITRPEAFLAAGRTTREYQGRGNTVGLELSGLRMVVRRALRGGLVALLNRDLYLGCDRPLAELAVTEKLRQAGVAVPEVLAVVVRRAGAGFYRHHVVTREVEDHQDLQEALCADLSAHERYRALRTSLQAAGRAVRAMHDAGVLHTDLNLKNILVPRRPPWDHAMVIDLDGAKDPGRLDESARYAQLDRLARSAAKLGAGGRPVTARELLAFGRGYYGKDREGLRRAAQWLAGRRWRMHRLRWKLFGVQR